ncbi:roadblock/LC7 domain-containing protein [Streptomyces griseorubiginosus]|uniref:Roadblock/LAMTOR2 domain-containing protein n=1 Tax=Streptomyces griseorubiginosus TaxID=67304 RepID=A0A117QXG5_9ACTN|nr:roadblock/LC7 domain-containing protein [Streptomyces griseorubiginosus]KUN59503.1 hypothetical protein AQJ54_39325 [Streptomyces griseorubiginosus]
MNVPTGPTRANKLGWALGNLDVGGVHFAVLASIDGLRMAHSDSTDVDDAERFAAALSGFRSLGTGIATSVGGNGLRQLLLEFDNRFVFITAAGEGALLGVVADTDVQVDLITHRMNELAERLGRELAAPTRQPSEDGDPQR